MASQITITLNAKQVLVPANATIRQAAEMHGVEIPTFCYDDRLKPFASCFLCVVEIENVRTLRPACSTPVAPGMVIHTHSDRVKATRKMALDLLLSDHAGDCVAPCSTHCPSHTDVQGYVAHIANGEFEAATRLIKTRLALPVVCGTVCPNPCEAQCRRGLVDEAIAIRALKRFAAEYDLEHGPFVPETKPSTGLRADIVGGGPAGLAAAYYLRQMGHEVHIHEALPELGGMTRYGIPKFRLPWNKLDAEIKSITDLGVHVHTNKKLGKDFTIADLQKNGAKSVLIAIGAHASKPMGVENENADGVMGGIDFLREVVLGKLTKIDRIEDCSKMSRCEAASSPQPERTRQYMRIADEEVNEAAGRFSTVPPRVAVIGGGDVAMDCARVARRLGSQVTLIYRRSQKEMPALHHEQEQTREEGVTFKFLTAPLSVVLDKNGRAEALRVVTMELGEPDSSGRRRPIPVNGSEQDLPFDLIISAIGQDADLSCLNQEMRKPETTKWKTISYDTNVMTTSLEGVFTAGDCSFGPNTVVQALAEGYKAAQAMHLYMTGAPMEFKQTYQISRGRIEELDREDFAPRFEQKKRTSDITLPTEQRLKDDGYAPISLSMAEAQALAEATRCIECGCSARFDCKLRKYSTEYNATEKRFCGEKRKYKNDERHPLIRFESEKCITCGNCVRMCSEVRNINALSFVKRGFQTHITPSFEDSLDKTSCDACGMCVDLCPTGAISLNTDKKCGPWPYTERQIACTLCDKHCALNLWEVEGRVIRITSVEKSDSQNGLICVWGRFAHRLLAEPKLFDTIIKLLEQSTQHLEKNKQTIPFEAPRLTREDLNAKLKTMF